MPNAMVKTISTNEINEKLLFTLLNNNMLATKDDYIIDSNSLLIYDTINNAYAIANCKEVLAIGKIDKQIKRVNPIIVINQLKLNITKKQQLKLDFYNCSKSEFVSFLTLARTKKVSFSNEQFINVTL